MMHPVQSETSQWRVLKKLALSLHDRQANEVEKDSISDLQPDLDDLIAKGVIVQHDAYLRFFHESLQDYVFSRAFVEEGRSLREYILESPQDLSQRSTVRQILTFARGTNTRGFLDTASSLLSDEGIRFHLRDVVFDILRDDDSPERAHWDLLEPFLTNPDSEEHLSSLSVAIQPSWLRLADREGILIHWMSSNDLADRDRATTLLTHLHRVDSDRVAVLLLPFLSIGQDWQDRIRRIVATGVAQPTPGYFRFLRDALPAGVFDDGSRLVSGSLFFAVYEWPGKNATLAARWLAAYLRRAAELSEGPNPLESTLPQTGASLEQYISACGRHSPTAFSNAALPFVIQVVTATAQDREGDSVKTGDPWTFRHLSPGHGVADILYETLEDSLRSMARNRSSSLGRLTRILVRYGDYESLRFLLYRIWMNAPDAFWPEACTFLLEMPSPFRCGYMDSPYWTTRELLESLQEVAPRDRLRELEARVLDFTPGWETTSSGHRSRGRAQLTLLGSFPETNLSDAGKRRLGELRRKFGVESEMRPRGIEVGFVPSPIPEDAAARMSDDQWLSAIQTYDTDERPDFLKGGATELSRVLGTETSQQPERFALLALQFPNDVHESYVDSVLRGIGDAHEIITPALLFDLIRRFYSMPDRPGGRWISRPLARIADRDIPKDILDIVTWYATEHPDPSRDIWRADGPNRTEYYGGDPYMAGINSVRGACAEAVSALLWPSARRMISMVPALQGLVSDRTVAVRSCAALALRSAFRHDEDLAVELFLVLVESDDILLSTDQVERFIATATRTHFSELRPVIQRMISSEVAAARLSGGRQAALAALSHDEASDLGDECLRGDGCLREGVAQVAAANVTMPDLGDKCANWLSVLFNDPERSVREAAAGWTTQLSTEGLAGLRDLAAAYIASASYLDDELPLLRALDESVAPVADLALEAIERLVEHAESGDRGGVPRFTLTAGVASKLAVRAYTSAAGADLRERALDAVDRLLAARVPDIEKLVGSLEH